ncbi:MAG: hypothetical protein Q8O84_02075 [Nanoarchaeota archaeon]|nr:hypothetical protein [Nanoarchaeota archaeon]
MTNLIQDVKPRVIVSAYVEAPFDIALKTFKKNNYRLISLEENARLRMQEGKDAYCSKNGNWVKEDFIYVKGKGVYLSKNFPICENPEQATACHKNIQEFYLTNEQVEKSLEDSILLSRNANDFEILTSDFKNNKITNYAFGEHAEDYGKFLKEAEIKNMPILFISFRDKPFARKAWFGSLDSRSSFVSCGDFEDGGEGLNLNFRSRGVKN